MDLVMAVAAISISATFLLCSRHRTQASTTALAQNGRENRKARSVRIAALARVTVAGGNGRESEAQRSFFAVLVRTTSMEGGGDQMKKAWRANTKSSRIFPSSGKPGEMRVVGGGEEK